jgi:hypothetical protein
MKKLVVSVIALAFAVSAEAAEGDSPLTLEQTITLDNGARDST